MALSGPMARRISFRMRVVTGRVTRRGMDLSPIISRHSALMEATADWNRRVGGDGEPADRAGKAAQRIVLVTRVAADTGEAAGMEGLHEQGADPSDECGQISVRHPGGVRGKVKPRPLARRDDIKPRRNAIGIAGEEDAEAAGKIGLNGVVPRLGGGFSSHPFLDLIEGGGILPRHPDDPIPLVVRHAHIHRVGSSAAHPVFSRILIPHRHGKPYSLWGHRWNPIPSRLKLFARCVASRIPETLQPMACLTESRKAGR